MTWPTSALVTRAMSRGWFRCPCGKRSTGRLMTWPDRMFYLHVDRVCERGLLCPWFPPGAGAVHEHAVRMGPFPPETPVCKAHRRESAY